MCEECAHRAREYIDVTHFKLKAVHDLYVTLRPEPTGSATVSTVADPVHCWWDASRRADSDCVARVDTTLKEAMLVPQSVGSQLWTMFMILCHVQ